MEFALITLICLSRYWTTCTVYMMKCLVSFEVKSSHRAIRNLSLT